MSSPAVVVLASNRLGVLCIKPLAYESIGNIGLDYKGSGLIFYVVA